MSWLGDLLNFRFKWRADEREEHSDERAGRGELLQLIDQQIDNVQRALELASDEAEREALSRTLRSYRARKDSILEIQIQFHPAMPTEAPPASGATLAPISAAPLAAPATSDAADELSSLGVALAGEEQWLAAAIVFHRVQQLRPNEHEPFYNRGLCLHHAGQSEEALADYNRALQLRPDHPDTLNNRAIALGQLNRHEEELADFNRALQLRPDHPSTLYNRGITLQKLGRHKEALADYDESLRLRPAHVWTLENKAIALAYVGQSDEALSIINSVSNLDPNPYNSLYQRACVYAVLGRTSEALEDLQRAIAGDPKIRARARTDPDFDTSAPTRASWSSSGRTRCPRRAARPPSSTRPLVSNVRRPAGV